MFNKPNNKDFLFLSMFLIAITLHPFYLYGRINIFELGIYLPGIDSVLNGMIPYRDFFHLRGPLELLIPAVFMQYFGNNMANLATYFYVGTIITLLFYVLIGKELYSSKIVLYLMVPVLIARTFPRVVFTYWGGMRYGYGALSILLFIFYIKSKKNKWLILSGVFSAVSFLTSIEIGICSIFAIILSIIFKDIYYKNKAKLIISKIYYFIVGNLIFFVPMVLYLIFNKALWSYVDSNLSIILNMNKVVPQLATVPRNFIELICAIFNPSNKNFRHMTPVYCYVLLIIYFIKKWKNQKINESDFGIICIFLYGVAMYYSAFRNIQASQFEMALQPEKIILFYLIEKFLVYLKVKKGVLLKSTEEKLSLVNLNFKKNWKIYLINIYFVGVCLSSWGYSLQRYNKRFYAFKYLKNLILLKETRSLAPMYGEMKNKIFIEKIGGMVLPTDQAQDFLMTKLYFDRETNYYEPVFMFPELAIYSYIIDRPFIGRFPMVTFSWFNDQWHEELMNDLKSMKPRYTIMPKELTPNFNLIYFKVKKNKEKFNEVYSFIKKNYKLVNSTHSLLIYKWKDLED